VTRRSPAPHPTRARRPAPLTAVKALAPVLALSLLASCASAVGESKGAGAGPTAGGTLKVGVTTDLVPASAFTNSSAVGNALIGNVYDSLIDYPLTSLKPKPKLATSWKFSDGGKKLTLQLRDDVTFHDGRPFTSKDVAFSIKTWADPQWTVQLQRTAAAITGFDTSKPHAITLTFAHPLSNVLDLLDMVPIIDSKTLDQLREGKAFVGTGPFKFKSWSPGSKLELVRNDDYWGGKPHLDGVEIDVVPDPQSLVSELRSGQIDEAIGLTGRDVSTLSKDDAYTVTAEDGAESQVYVGANVNNPALSDVRLRQAIAYALDRKRIIDEVYRGYGTPGDLPWPDYSPAYDEKANQEYAYDPAKAKKLVAEVKAEGKQIPTLPLVYASNEANYDATAQIVQEDLAEIGIKVQLEPTEQAEVVKDLIGGGFKGLWILGHSYAQYTPSTLAVSAYPFNADNNTSHYINKGYQAAADGAWQQSAEKAMQPSSYAALNEQLLDGLFLMEIGVLTPQHVTSASVHDVGLSKRGEPDYARTYLTEGTS